MMTEQTKIKTIEVGETVIDIFSDGNVDVWYRGIPVARVDSITRNLAMNRDSDGFVR